MINMQEFISDWTELNAVEICERRPTGSALESYA